MFTCSSTIKKTSNDEGSSDVKRQVVMNDDGHFRMIYNYGIDH